MGEHLTQADHTGTHRTFDKIEAKKKKRVNI